MSENTSDTQTCKQCGYVFEPFETACPKCEHQAAEHVADAPIQAVRLDSLRQVLTRPLTLRLEHSTLVTLFVIDLIVLAIAVCYAYTIHPDAQDPKSPTFVSRAWLACVAGGFIFGIPSVWRFLAALAWRASQETDRRGDPKSFLGVIFALLFTLLFGVGLNFALRAVEIPDIELGVAAVCFFLSLVAALSLSALFGEGVSAVVLCGLLAVAILYTILVYRA